MTIEFKKMIVGIMLLIMAFSILYFNNHTDKKMIAVVDSNHMIVKNISTGKEMKIDCFSLFENDRSTGFYKKDQLGFKINDWRKDYTLTFLKNNKKQVDLTVYTMNPMTINDRLLLPNDKVCHTLGGRPVLAELKINFILYKKIYYTNLNQKFYDNLQDFVNQ